MYRHAVVVEETKTGYSAYAVAVPGCVATGTTKPIVLHNMRHAIAEHLALGGKTEDPDVAIEVGTPQDYVDLAVVIPLPEGTRPPEAEMAADLLSRLAAHGFSIVDLGGESTALFADREGIETFIRHADGPWAPTSLEDPVVIEETVRDLREEGSPPEDEVDTSEFAGYTLRNVLTMLDHPARDFVSLELRLRGS